METAQQHMEEAKAKMEQEKEQSKEVKREIWELISWTEIFDYAENRHEKDDHRPAGEADRRWRGLYDQHPVPDKLRSSTQAR